MTNKEALAAKAQCPVQDESLEVALIDRGVDPAQTYISDNQNDVELALVDLLYSIYTKPDISEGQYSLSHPDFLRKLKERILQLATKLNLTDILSQLQDATPSISSKSVW
jgi:hypothetical protein